ncbi:MAG: hypothetical protein IKF18_08910 [Erysipelotrichaceae bacterium]|nr:hypothetical protein [Erysipelotrichaceae bacterium]MBR3168773.1 hypothetical protein [Erysipelotrichaceae bacterium]
MLYKKLLIIAVSAVLLAGLAGCGSSSGAAPAHKRIETGPLNLSEEETVYHGVHLRLPEIYSMERMEGTGYDATASVNDPESPVAANGSIEFTVRKEACKDPTKYDDREARDFYVGWAEEKESAEVSARRINNVDALIVKEPDGSGFERTSVMVFTHNQTVVMEFNSYQEEISDVFDRCIETIYAEEDVLPQRTSATLEKNLTENGLTMLPWEVKDLLIHVPSGLSPVKYNGETAWATPDANSLIVVAELGAEVLELDRGQMEAILSRQDGFIKLLGFNNKMHNGMRSVWARYLSTMQGREVTIYWLIVQPEFLGEKTVLFHFMYPKGDTETEKLFDAAAATLHHPDSWDSGETLEFDQDGVMN